MGNAYGDLGNLFNVQNEPEEAATYYLKAIAIFEKEGLLKDVVVRYSNLSKLFEQTKDYPAQQAYARKAIDAAKKGGDAFSLSVAYMAYAQAMNVVKKYPETKTAMDSAAVYFTADGTYIDYQTNFYLLYAVACQMNGQMACAKEYFQKCYDAAVRYSYKYGLAESQLQLGTIMVGERKFKEAENFLLNGIREAKELGYINMLYKGYEKLSGLYSESGRYREALEAYQQFKLLGDSMISMESKRTIAELEKQYETEKKDNHIVLQQAQLKQKSILNYILIGSAAALAIISLLGYRNYRHKHKLQQHRISELETENQLAATEAVLKGEAQERTRLAKDLHDGLGGLLSGIKYSLNTMKENMIMTPDNTQVFERSLDLLDTSIQEMRRVAHNMMPETLVKFGIDTALRDFCHDVNETGTLEVTYQSMSLENAAIDQTTAVTIYRIVQELLNNIMKHAAARTAIVQVSKTGPVLSVTVEDDGTGFDTSILKQPKGMGWGNVRNRVEFLRGKFDINSKPGVGTSVLIELNV
ncbi:MAG TPA: sensor histidine kinase [Agriterribacter sp.]|nr:sensor histidine kinase [Agriterribacter sp.]